MWVGGLLPCLPGLLEVPRTAARVPQVMGGEVSYMGQVNGGPLTLKKTR